MKGVFCQGLVRLLLTLDLSRCCLSDLPESTPNAQVHLFRQQVIRCLTLGPCHC